MKYTPDRISLLFALLMMFHVNIWAQEEEKILQENKANQYMNQSSLESLVNAFDSPNRAGWQHPDKVISLFGDVSKQKIMDLGAGSGYFSLRLAAKGAQVIAADVSDSFQGVIQEKLDNEDFQQLARNIELRKVPYDNPGLSKSEVNGILIVNTWHHIDGRRSYMKKALEGVKKGGKIIIVDFKLGVAGGPPENHKLGLEIAMNEIQDLNFSEIQVDTTLLERQYIIIGIK
jgi:2-polyprenyl-3-methyl-5-hydroxy-6-metoxy-1,4-benzoquinol methylase